MCERLAPRNKNETASLKGGLTHGTSCHPYDGNSSEQTQSGTSIFDPVLTELAYRWFCQPGGKILDPFAGGSVRGIVAAVLGRQYIGVELRKEQVEANREQWEQVRDNLEQQQIAPIDDFVSVKVSAAMARLPFNGCEIDYIKNNCKASCCQSSTAKTGTMITIHPTEQAAIEDRGGVVIDGLLQPKKDEKRCPFKTNDELCGIHFTPDKPFGCIASPFTLNKSKTLIVRNRYKLLKCYDVGAKLPAYKAFRASLDLIFGLEESQRICDHFDEGGGDLIAKISYGNYQKLIDNDEIKHGNLRQDNIDFIMPVWINDDSRNIPNHTDQIGEIDMIFSCPPYADLEVYSNDPLDLSTLPYEEFKKSYYEIIAKACAQLKENSFACFVVGEVRGKDGNYYNFVGDTIDAFIKAGLHYYNEMILVTCVGSLPIRVGKSFTVSRKIGKTHQNCLVFLKGNAKKAVEKLGECEFGEIPESMLDVIE